MVGKWSGRDNGASRGVFSFGQLKSFLKKLRAALRLKWRQLIRFLWRIGAKHPFKWLRKVIRWHIARPALARAGWLAMSGVLLFTVFLEVYNLRGGSVAYALDARAQMLLSDPKPELGEHLKMNKQGTAYEYSRAETGAEMTSQSISPRFSASFSLNPRDGMTYEDPATGVKFTMKPNFGVASPEKQDNRLVYPLNGFDGQMVQTLQVASAKEDIVLNSYDRDKAQFSFKLELEDGTEARVEQDGSIGVYGADTALLGSVSTGGKKDDELLKKARENAEKDRLIFRLPNPFVIDSTRQQGKARAWYGLKGDKLTIYADNLKQAKYPLTIDPTIYIESAAQLMQGNNESNIDFDVDNQLIQKGKTTGGRFDVWNNAMSLPTGIWRHSSAIYGGFVYVIGGNAGGSATSNVYWARVNSTTGAYESANPGDGVCAGWCTDAAYALPAARQDASLVAYNGYLYLIGGNSGGAAQNTIYVAKIGANGEPQLWRPTASDAEAYWYTSSLSLPSGRNYTSSVAYNNRLYISGGTTTLAPNGTGQNLVLMADILPTGKLYGSNANNFYSLTSMPATLHSHNMLAYNDRLYIVGGAVGGTTQSAVYFSKVLPDGTITSWQTTTPISTNNGNTLLPRASIGGTFAVIWGGFIYISGGCGAASMSGGYCPTASILEDVQIASINADGTITDWTQVRLLTSSAPNKVVSQSFIAWRNRVYSIGGCSAQTSANNCNSPVAVTKYGQINQDGDVSTVSTSSAASNSTGPCTGTTATDCDMPSNAGNVAGAVVVNNGFIYYFGGCNTLSSGRICANGASGKATTTVSYAYISSDGNIRRAPSCMGSYVSNSSWCLVGTGMPGGNNGLAAFSYAVFNNNLYFIGGTTGARAGWTSNIYRTTFNSDGSWSMPWSTQSFSSVGISQSSMGYSYSFTRANPSAASTQPGNLYILGGCNYTDIGLNCGDSSEANTFNTVYKCYITTDGSIDTSNQCTTSGQLQLDSEVDTPGDQGLGVMAGTVYANYVYLMGGQSPNRPERGEVMYAKIDNNNNIVAADGGSTWVTSPNSISPVRRRGAAFGYNGYLYALAGYNVTDTGTGGSLNDLLYAKIDVSDGSIGAFTTSSVTVDPRWDLRLGVNNGYVYAIGGCSVGTPPASCTTLTSTVQTFQLYNNYSGSPRSFSSSSSLFGTDRRGAGATVVDGYIYLAGGCTSASDCTATTQSVTSAKINDDGTLGTWTTQTNLPAGRAWGTLQKLGGHIYYVGGQDSAGSAQSTVYYASVSGGTVSSWSAGTSLPSARTRIGAAVWNDRIYVVGGLDGADNATNTIYASSRQATGGNIASWSAQTNTLPVARSGATVVAYANNLYVYGGYDGSNYLSDAQYAQISNIDGVAGVSTWTATTSLPTTFRNGTGFAANGFMYILGGRSADSVCESRLFVAPISANTTIATGNKPTGVGEWYETSTRYPGNRYGAASVYNEGKIYILGGACGATYTGSDRVLSATLQAQPQIAKYSRMIDTDKDVFPTVWLMNGLDNSTGARWYMRYRTMTDPQSEPWALNGPIGQNCSQQLMSTWGQETNFGEVTLGKVQPYVPLDASGNVTNGGGIGGGCARYFYMNLTIDSQFAYGYPEDVSRGPTIADLSLFFTASPSQRLIHGKTFNAGQQQPLDTPCRRSNNSGDPDYQACPLE